ncbi:response regulator [Metabacillus malikii]|uniref:Two-component system response regulator YesN n=1 Tax=Metabacillus malikii TaxID=1504265 RepID=A0ABT9ZCV0_9BACI|nr:response regulator [Metabacillus malikii]MDQ0230094.1 two-component system response regulator YesN [Metabacillus malikii]
MINIMLVDDEQLEREGLKLMLTKERTNFRVVAEAKNGKQAVELALIHKPDLIFMDIKMPEFDGLEAIRRILNVLPQTKYIMVSAFDTFEYAREAMKYGIKEYLLKPSKMSELLEAYDRMANEITAEKLKDAESKQLNQLVEMEFIISFIMDHVHEFNETDWEDLLDLGNKTAFVTVFSFTAQALHPTREQRSSWYQNLKQVIQTYYPKSLVGPLTGFQVPVLRFVEDDDDRDEFARSIILNMQKQLKDTRISAGIGSIVKNVNDYSTSYQQALDALGLTGTKSKGSYLVYHDGIKQMRKQLVPSELEKKLIDVVKKGHSQHGLQLFEQYFQVIQEANNYEVNTTHRAIEHFFIVLTRSLAELGYNDEIQINLGQFSTTLQLKTAAKAHLLKIIEHIAEYRSNGVQTLLLQAKDYVDSRYQKSISLEEVAEHAGISSYYLSKLFKETFNITFIDYLTKKRIEKAKELLLGTMSLKEIALTIGYKDPNYFSRVFKKATGSSPTEYRK